MGNLFKARDADLVFISLLSQLCVRMKVFVFVCVCSCARVSVRQGSV